MYDKYFRETNHKVIAYDMPGRNGRSGNELDFKRAIKECKKIVEKEKEVIVVAHSMGGFIGIQLTNLKNIRKILIVATPFSLEQYPFLEDDVKKFLPCNIDEKNIIGNKIICIYPTFDIVIGKDNGIKMRKKFKCRLVTTRSFKMKLHVDSSNTDSVIRIIKQIL